MVAVLSIAGAGFRRTRGTPEEPLPTMASSRIPAEHLRQYSDLAMAWMQEYLRIDTTTPPGHEMQAVSFYKKILDQEGIENRPFEYVPGRGNLRAPPLSLISGETSSTQRTQGITG